MIEKLKNIFTKDNLEIFRHYFNEVLLLALLVSALSLGYKYYQKENFTDLILSGGIFVILGFVSIFRFFLKEKTKVTSYETIGGVQKAIKDIFSKVEGVEITQTYVKNNLLSGTQDILIKNVIQNIKDKSRWPQVTRVFILFDPYDINFAEHSKEMAGESVYNRQLERYGENLQNIFANGIDQPTLVNIIPSITIVSKKSLITFPSRAITKYNEFPNKLIGKPDETATRGDLIKSKKFSEKYSNFLSVAESKDLNDIKDDFYQKDVVAYYYSVIYSAAKEIFHKEKIQEKILYLGLIGSLVQLIKSSEAASIDYKQIKDLDLLIVVDKLNSAVFENAKNCCEVVCRRFSIPGKVDFFVETRSTPVKAFSISSGVAQIPLHLLIADKATCRKWDKFISFDRIQPQGNEPFTWVNDNRANMNLKDLVPSQRFTFSHLVKGYYSISNCLKVLKRESKLKIREWIKNDYDEYELIESEQNLNLVEIVGFAEYSLKWGILNFFNAADNLALNENSYTRDYKFAANKISELNIGLNSKHIIDLLHTPDKNIQAEDVNAIIEYLEILEQRVLSCLD